MCFLSSPQNKSSRIMRKSCQKVISRPRTCEIKRKIWIWICPDMFMKTESSNWGQNPPKEKRMVLHRFCMNLRFSCLFNKFLFFDIMYPCLPKFETAQHSTVMKIQILKRFGHWTQRGPQKTTGYIHKSWKSYQIPEPNPETISETSSPWSPCKPTE